MKKIRDLLKEAESARDMSNDCIANMVNEIKKQLPNIGISCSGMFGVRYFDITTDHYKASNFLEKSFKIELKSCDKMPETEDEMMTQMKMMAKEKIAINDAVQYMNKFLKDSK